MKTKQLTDIEIAKKIVKDQKKRSEDNFNEFKEVKEFNRKRNEDWKKRLKDNKYV